MNASGPRHRRLAADRANRDRRVLTPMKQSPPSSRAVSRGFGVSVEVAAAFASPRISAILKWGGCERKGRRRARGHLRRGDVGRGDGPAGQPAAQGGRGVEELVAHTFRSLQAPPGWPGHFPAAGRRRLVRSVYEQPWRQPRPLMLERGAPFVDPSEATRSQPALPAGPRLQGQQGERGFPGHL